jgi:transcriptional regulator with XRE-family HTH domain
MSKKAVDLEWRHEIAVRFQQAIKERNLSNTEAAKTLGIKRQTLWLYLREKATPGGDILKKACEAWGITISRKGVEFAAGAFGGLQQPAQMEAKQLSLLEALELLRGAQLDTQVVGKTGNYFELRIRIRSSEEVPSR